MLPIAAPSQLLRLTTCASVLFAAALGAALGAASIDAAPADQSEPRFTDAGHATSASATDGLVVLLPSPPPGPHAKMVGADEAFSIAAQDFGPAGDTAGGVLIQDRASERWFELVEVSSKGAVLGHSPPPNPDHPLSEAWDYRPLASKPAIELPLMTSGSINLPGSVRFDGDAILLRFNEDVPVPTARTELRIQRSELREAIEHCPPSAVGASEPPRRAFVLVYLVRGERAAEKTAEERTAIQAGHMANIRRLAEEKSLLVAGPFGKDNHDPTVRGLFIFDVPTLGQAQALTQTDPAVIEGVLAMRPHRLRTAADLRAVLEAGLATEAKAREEGRELPMEARIQSYALLRSADASRAEAVLRALEPGEQIVLSAVVDGRAGFHVIATENREALRARLAEHKESLGEHTLDEWWAGKELAGAAAPR